jgi:hypothetical protein
MGRYFRGLLRVERQFLDDLQTLQNLWRPSIEAHQLFSDDQIDAIFNDVDQPSTSHTSLFQRL